MKRGYIHVYTGDGGGKTTAALGVALRSLGHGRRVAVVQFMKGKKDLGEWEIQMRLGEKLGSHYHIYQFGKDGELDVKRVSQEDKDRANQALGFAKAEMLEKLKPQLLILDEINLAAARGLVSVDDVISMLKFVPHGVDIYLTGRKAPRKFRQIADFVTVIKDKKRPKYIPVRKGIDY
ncbi:MAG: cob(I)yrinic acid a,c-diamide adenosyltransferase [Candidatus Woesearchaeota archaeon]